MFTEQECWGMKINVEWGWVLSVKTRLMRDEKLVKCFIKDEGPEMKNEQC